MQSTERAPFSIMRSWYSNNGGRSDVGAEENSVSPSYDMSRRRLKEHEKLEVFRLADSGWKAFLFSLDSLAACILLAFSTK